MDNRRYIDIDNFEIYDIHPKVIPCDKEIAVAIANLNKLGYKTIASCAGHYKGGCYEQRNVDLSFLEEAKNDKHSIVREVRDDSFDCWIENTATFIYVAFDKDCVPKTIPEGFILEHENDERFDFIDISRQIDYYKDERKRTKEDIEEELKKYQNILNEWASNLPKREED